MCGKQHTTAWWELKSRNSNFIQRVWYPWCQSRQDSAFWLDGPPWEELQVRSHEIGNCTPCPTVAILSKGPHCSKIRGISEEHGGYGKWRMWDSEPGHFHDKYYMGQFLINLWPHCIVFPHQHPTNPVLTTYLGLELGDQLRSLLLAFLFTPCFPCRTPDVKGQFIMSLGGKPQMDREGFYDIMMFARKWKEKFWEEIRCFPKGLWVYLLKRSSSRMTKNINRISN